MMPECKTELHTERIAETPPIKLPTAVPTHVQALAADKQITHKTHCRKDILDMILSIEDTVYNATCS